MVGYQQGRYDPLEHDVHILIGNSIVAPNEIQIIGVLFIIRFPLIFSKALLLIWSNFRRTFLGELYNNYV